MQAREEEVAEMAAVEVEMAEMPAVEVEMAAAAVQRVQKQHGGHSHCSRFQEQTKNILSPGRRRRSFRHQRTTQCFRSQS